MRTGLTYHNKDKTNSNPYSQKNETFSHGASTQMLKCFVFLRSVSHFRPLNCNVIELC